MTGETPSKADHETYQLMKSLRRVAEYTDAPSTIEAVIIPEPSFADLLAPVFSDGIRVLVPTEMGGLKIHTDGDLFSGKEGLYDEETTLDLRIDTRGGPA